MGEKCVAGKGAASLKVMRAETIADKLRAAKPNAWISSISLKDRAAVFGGGKNPDVVLWHDHESGQFVTSSAFAQSFPMFLAQGNAGLQEVRNSIWNVANPSWHKVHARTAGQKCDLPAMLLARQGFEQIFRHNRQIFKCAFFGQFEIRCGH